MYGFPQRWTNKYRRRSGQNKQGVSVTVLVLLAGAPSIWFHECAALVNISTPFSIIYKYLSLFKTRNCHS